MVERVTATSTAIALIARLRERHGELLFHQSGGCCDGSAPMCYPAGEFRTGPQDVLLGEIAGCPFYMSTAQFELWAHTQLIIDVVPGRGAGFSLSRRPRACASSPGVVSSPTPRHGPWTVRVLLQRLRDATAYCTRSA
jgi:uncharacterized protein (DUF779 family)